MKIIFAIFIVVLLFFSCSSQEPFTQKQGIVIEHFSLFEADTTMQIAAKIWYKGEQSIQEVPKLNIISDSLGKRAFTTITGYAYLHPGNNVCLEYRNFNDTAKAIRHFADIDSVDIAMGGWNFYSNEDFSYDTLFNLDDTVINKVSYGRIRLNKKVGDDNTLYFDLYFRCDKKDALVKFLNR